MFETDIKLYHIIEPRILRELFATFAKKYNITITAYSGQFEREMMESPVFANPDDQTVQAVFAGLEAPLAELHNRNLLSDGKSLFFQSKTKHIEAGFIPVMYQDTLVLVLGLSVIDQVQASQSQGHPKFFHEVFPINSPAMDLIEPIDNIKREIALFVEAGFQRYKLTGNIELDDTSEAEPEPEVLIVFTTPDKVILDCTPTLHKLTGASSQKLIGLQFIDFLQALSENDATFKNELIIPDDATALSVELPLNEELMIKEIRVHPELVGQVVLGYEFHLYIIPRVKQSHTDNIEEQTETGPAADNQHGVKPAVREVAPMLVSAQELVLFHALPLPLAVLDEKHIVKIWNQEMSRISKQPASAMVGHALTEKLSGTCLNWWPEEMNKFGNSDLQQFTTEHVLEILDKDNQIISAKCSIGKTVVNEQTFYLLVVLDWKQGVLTAEAEGGKGAAGEPSRSRSAGTTLNKSEKLELLRQVFGAFAHHVDMLSGELYNHVSSLDPEATTSTENRNHIDKLRSVAKKMTVLKHNLKYFSGHEIPYFDSLDLNAKLSSWTSQYQDLAGPGVKIQLNLSENIGLLYANSKQVKHSVRNLVLNAAESYVDGGNIIIHTRRHHMGSGQNADQPGEKGMSYTVLEIIDSGRGIPVAVREKLFEPFNTNKPREIGRGMGLASVYGIMKNHNGFITIKSLEDQGTIVSLYFPNVDTENDGETADSLFISKQKILVIDDDPGIIEVNSITLRHFGFEVMAAETATQGLELYRQHHNDLSLIIQDISLPDMEGIDCANALYDISSAVPLVLSSGYQCNEEFYQFMQRTGAVFLQKPYTSNKLYQTIQSVLVRKA